MTGFETVECQTREEWLEVRKGGIGASEAAILIGADRYGTTLADLWARKCGILPDTIEETERMRLGARLEPVLRELYMETTGRIVLWSPPYSTIHRSRVYPWALATPDGEIAPENEDGGPGVLELKCADARLAHEGKDEPPLAFLAQVQWQMLVTGYRWGSVAVLLGGNAFRSFDVPRHDEAIALLIAAGQELWDFVQRREAPPLDVASPSTEVLLGTLYAADNGETVDLPSAAVEWDARRQTLKAQHKAVEAELDEIENRIKEAIGPALLGRLPDGARYQWKQIVRHMPARAAYEARHRELRRLNAPKGKR